LVFSYEAKTTVARLQRACPRTQITNDPIFNGMPPLAGMDRIIDYFQHLQNASQGLSEIRLMGLPAILPIRQVGSAARRSLLPAGKFPVEERTYVSTESILGRRGLVNRKSAVSIDLR
jgi:hypothetical protein